MVAGLDLTPAQAARILELHAAFWVELRSAQRARNDVLHQIQQVQ